MLVTLFVVFPDNHINKLIADITINKIIDALEQIVLLVFPYNKDSP